jgi:AraC-like DNA-binding protein
MLDSLNLTLGNLSLIPEIQIVSSSEQGKRLEEVMNLQKTRLHFNKEFTAICIPRKVLAQSIKRKSIATAKLFNLEKWKANAPTLDFVNCIEQTVKSLLLDKYPTIEITAKVTGLSVRSLQRYLSQHNLTYSRLMDKVRYELALKMLNDDYIPLVEIAYTLGFSDPANFSHAFRRWAGISPSQFRKFNNSCLSP